MQGSRIRGRPTALVACLLALLVAAPARAGWVRSPASGQWPYAVRGVGMGSATLAWAVGGQPGVALVLKSSDQFATLAGTQEITGHGAANQLNAVWVAPGGATVHAFGNQRARASWNGTAWSSTNVLGPDLINVNAIAFVDATTGYLAGQDLTQLASYVGRWTVGSSALALSVPTSMRAFNAASFVAPDDLYLVTDDEMWRYHDVATPSSARFYQAPSAKLTGLSFEGRLGIAIGNSASTNLVYLVDGTRDVTTRPATSIPFNDINAVFFAPRGFAVAVGAGGKIAETQDGGVHWKQKPPAGTQDLLAVSCWDENTCVATGTLSELLYYRNGAPSAVVSSAAGGLNAGEGETVCLSAANADPDGDDVTILWSDPDGLAGPASAIEGSTAAAPPCVVTAANLCAARDYALNLHVDDGRLARDVPVSFHVDDTVRQPPAIPSLAPAGPYRFELGKSYALQASSTAECGRSVSFGWTASGPLPAPALSGGGDSVATFDLSRPASCDVGTATLEVAATDSAGKVSRSVQAVTVVEAPFKPVVAVGFTNGFKSGGVLQPGESTRVTLTPSHACTTVFDYAWECGGKITPGNVGEFDFENFGALCTADTIQCTVTVTPRGHLPETVSFTVGLAAGAAQPTSVDLTFSAPFSNAARLLEGERVKVGVRASQTCNPGFAVTWACSGVDAPADGTVEAEFAHPGSLCQPKQVHCTVTATPDDGRPAGQAQLDLMFERTGFPTTLTATLDGGLESGAPLRDGDSATVRVEASNACGSSYRLDWACAGVDAPPTDTAVFTFQHPGALCDGAEATCTVTATPTDGNPGASVRTAVRFTASAFEPVELLPLPVARPVVDCLSAATIAVAPPAFVDAPRSSCPVRFEWRQVDGPPVATAVGPGGALELSPDRAAFGAVVGRTARFEVRAGQGATQSAPQTVEVLFVPARFVAFEHRADRPVASAGQEVGFVASLVNRCESAVDGVDLRLALEDLEYEPGSARLDGVALGDPERNGRELVFRGIPLRAASMASPVLSYSARRSAFGAGTATSRARAFLSALPDTLVSDEGAAQARFDQGVPAMSCGCGSAGAGEPAWGALGVVLLLIRRRPRSG